MLQDSSHATNREIALMGLVGGLSFGVLNAILYLFFLFPMVAHHLFRSYMHYDAVVLGYAAGYVGILGIMGMSAALLAPRTLFIRKLSRKRTGGEPLD